jgi:NAD(P)-dependent dehydrogenase (short-subunit alcohol dehydrogenase family)
MVERLAAAGHHVHVISDPSEISDQLGDEQFEIVMAYYAQRAIVETQLRDTSIIYLPVAHADTEEEQLAESAYRRSLSSDDSVKTFLKTIHRTLKDRQS